MFFSVGTTRWRFIASFTSRSWSWAISQASWLWWCDVVLNFLWAQGLISSVALSENGFPIRPRVPLCWIPGEQHLRALHSRLRQHEALLQPAVDNICSLSRRCIYSSLLPAGKTRYIAAIGFPEVNVSTLNALWHLWILCPRYVYSLTGLPRDR